MLFLDTSSSLVSSTQNGGTCVHEPARFVTGSVSGGAFKVINVCSDQEVSKIRKSGVCCSRFACE